MTAAHLKITLTIHGGTPRPLELGASALVGSGRAADVRIPDTSLAPVHLRLLRDRDEVVVIALAAGARLGGEALAIDDVRVCTGVAIEVGPARIVAAPWDRGTELSREHTSSLARELVRDLLAGPGAPAEAEALAPELIVEAGPVAGTRLPLPPPEARVVIGRGDTSTWVLLDPDLSRNHAAIERRFDGVWVTDLDSKNGTLVDGKPAPREPPGSLLGDGAVITLGDTVLRYRDPAAARLSELETRLQTETMVASAETITRQGKRAVAAVEARGAAAVAVPRGRWPLVVLAVVALAAIALMIALFATS